MEELPTERTAIMMTTLKTEGRPSIPALTMEMTNGEAVASTEFDAFKRRLSVYGTSSPTKAKETT